MNENLIKNYESINPACDTTQKWCISCKMASAKQVTVQFSDGKQYKYLSRYPVAEGILQLLEIALWRAHAKRMLP